MDRHAPAMEQSPAPLADGRLDLPALSRDHPRSLLTQGVGYEAVYRHALKLIEMLYPHQPPKRDTSGVTWTSFSVHQYESALSVRFGDCLTTKLLSVHIVGSEFILF